MFWGWWGSHTSLSFQGTKVCGLSCSFEGGFRLKLGSLTTVMQTSLLDVEISLWKHIFVLKIQDQIVYIIYPDN